MKLTVIVDNKTLIGKNFYSEPGLCYFIESEGKKILFDLGLSDIFLKNSENLNIPLDDIDYIVISHGHDDHIGGLYHLINFYKNHPPKKKPILITHPLTFKMKYLENNLVGNIIAEEAIHNYFDVRKTTEAFWLTDNLVFLGEIKRDLDFEDFTPKAKILIDGELVPDYLIEDSALAYKKDNSLVIITGCSHSGICNIIDTAKDLTKKDNILDIIGGLHLLNPSKEKVEGTINYISNIKPSSMHPSHCTKQEYICILSQVCDIKEIGIGSIIEY